MSETEQRVYVQREFSGGMISPKMLLRGDLDLYRKSALLMRNYIPTPQGSAERAPGTRYIRTESTSDARIIPYLSPANERSIIIMTPESMEVLFDVNERVRDDYTSVVDTGGGVLTFRKRINPNNNFVFGLTDWVANPDEYTSSDGFPGLGVYASPDDNNAIMRPRLGGGGIPSVTLSQQAVVDTPTTNITIVYRARYANNYVPVDQPFGGYSLTFEVSANSDMSSPLYSRIWDSSEYPDVGTVFYEEANFALPTVDWTGTLYIRITAEARSVGSALESNPRFRINMLNIFADGEVDIEALDEPLTTPYQAEDLPDLQYVQSPYENKELVIVHPKYPPHRFFFSTTAGAYVFQEIPFTNAPPAWELNNYPAACSSCNGRLVLAGGAFGKTLPGDPIAVASETIWLTKVGVWDEFSTLSEVDPDDSLELTSIYRSPIQWVFGQRTLLVGALEYEYSISSSSVQGVLSPSDVGVFLQSTHGSQNVQPAGFGNAVLFAADGGIKVRALTFTEEGNGWVADDLTMYNPELCISGVKRMVRQRNPHQMCLVLLNDGTLAIFHSEGNASGWTTYALNNAQIKDVCVIQDTFGVDVPYMLVERDVDGSTVTYLECIPNWTYQYDWDYSECTKFYQFETETATITGLEHLEDKIVQVYDQDRYVGFYRVTGGQITLTDGTDEGTTPMVNARVGLQHRCILRTLPPVKVDPGAKSRYVDFAVRVVNSTRPIVNEQRPSNRRPGMQLGSSQIFEEYEDVHVSTRGWDAFQSVEIMEVAPFRNEIVGIIGNLKEGNIP